MSRGARKIILWSVILVASAALFAYCFVSRFRLPAFFPFDWGGGSSSSGFTVLKEEEVAAPEELHMTWSSGQVRLLSGGDRLRVVQKGPSSFRQEQCFALEESDSGRVLTIRDCRRPGFYFLGFGIERCDLEITLPEKQYRALTADLSSADITTAALTAESLTLQSSSGDIEAAGNYGTAAVRSTSGDVRLEGLACSGKLQVGSTSGDVAAEGLSCGDLEASTASGDLKLAGRAGFAAVSSSSGNVKLDGLRSASEFRIKTVSGDIRGSGVEGTLLTVATTSGNIRLDGRYMGLQLNTTSGNADLTTSAALDSLRSDSVSGTVTVVMPDNGGFDLSFHKLSGSFHSDFSTTQDGEWYRYGDGGRSFSVNTVSGDFHLRQNG